MKNKKYGKLTIIKDLGIRLYSGRRQRFVLCKCECGTEKEILLNNLRSGNTKSCGCTGGRKTHGFWQTHPSLINIWFGMRSRCYNVGNSKYRLYGGRGIAICKEWLNDKTSFCNWALQNGWEKSLTIDRIDGNGDYEPSNCRFITAKENNRNRRDLKLNESLVEEIRTRYEDENITQKKLSEIYNVSHSTINKLILRYTWT